MLLRQRSVQFELIWSKHHKDFRQQRLAKKDGPTKQRLGTGLGDRGMEIL